MTLKERRLAKNYTQIDMAVKVGVSLSAYILWERGAMNPNEENQKKLDEVLELSEEEMKEAE